MPDKLKWGITAGWQDRHPTVTESTTGLVACGQSWCKGDCGLPALVLNDGEVERKVYGQMVAHGYVFQPWRVSWEGERIAVTLGETSVHDALGKIWV